MRAICNTRLIWGIVALFFIAVGITLQNLPVVAEGPTVAVTQPSTTPAVSVFINRVPGDEQDDASQKTRRALEKTVDQLDVDQQSLQKILTYISEKAEVSLDIHWKELEGAGVDVKETNISFNVSGVSWITFLNLTLQKASSTANTANLAWIIHDGVVTISTKEEIDSAKYRGIRFYDLSFMLSDYDHTVRPLEHCFGEGARNPHLQINVTRDYLFKQIADLIMAVVDQNSWRDTGSSIGSLKFSLQYLVVDQTGKNHQKIAAVLDELRCTNAISLRRYDIRDLLIPQENNPWYTAQPHPEPNCACPQSATQPATRPNLTPRQARVAALMAVIRNSVARNTWREVGGLTSSMTELDGFLYVTTSTPIHRQLETLFTQMRQPAAKLKAP